jgi:hypothetical protein
MAMKKTTLLIALSICFLFSFSQTPGSIMLNKGQKLNVQTTSNALITQEAMGQTTEIKIDLVSTNNIEVKSVKDTGYTLTNTITRMKTNMSFMGQDMNYDSEKKEDQESEMGKNFSKVLNHPNEVDINKTGKVTAQKKSVEADSLKQNMAESDMMSSMMQNMMGSADDGSAGITQAFQPIPKKVKAGYTWIDSVSSENSKSKTTYTIKEVKGNEALIDIKGTLQLNNKAEAQGMEVTNSSTGIVTGDETVDISTGIIKHKTTTLETTGTVQAMGQEIPVTSKITSVVTVTH